MSSPPRLVHVQMTTAEVSDHISIYRQARHALGQFRSVRSCYWLVQSIKKAAFDSTERTRASMNAAFNEGVDPWNFAGLANQRRHALMLSYIDRFCSPQAEALEIGCAEGMFTEKLATRCGRVLALDTSPVALARAGDRCQSADNIQFEEWDLRRDPVSGHFDAVFAMDILECLHNPGALRMARRKLIDCLRPGGLLFVSSTRDNAEVENYWWAKRLPRGRWIHTFLGKDPALRLLSESRDEAFVATVFERV